MTQRFRHARDSARACFPSTQEPASYITELWPSTFLTEPHISALVRWVYVVIDTMRGFQAFV